MKNEKGRMKNEENGIRDQGRKGIRDRGSGIGGCCTKYRGTSRKHSCSSETAHCFLLFSLFILLFSLFSCTDMFQPKVPINSEKSPGSLEEMIKSRQVATVLDPPSQLYVTPFYSRSELRLTWEKVEDAAYYMIERAVAVPVAKETGLEWEEPTPEEYTVLTRFWYDRLYIDEILKAPGLDSPEYQNRYYYRVSAYNPSKNLEASEPCEPEYAMLFRAPSNVQASGGTWTDRIQVRWERVDDAVSYEVWRSASEKGLPALLGTVLGNQDYFVNYIGQEDQGKDFFYIVTAQNSFGKMSLQTRPALGYAKMEGAPDSPVVRRSENFGRGNSRTETRIQWAEVDNAEYYAVYRFSSVDASLTILAKETTNTWLLDTAGLKAGVYYYYRVQAIAKDAMDRELKSAFSGPESGKPLSSMTRAELDSLAESFMLSPPNTVIAEKTGNSVTVKWLPPIGTDEERHEYRYNVYADSQIDGAFTDTAKAGVGATTDAEGFIRAEGLPLSQGTFFRVVVFNGSTESAPSVVVTPVPAAAIIVDATQRAFISVDSQANVNGVYPVRVTWKKPETEAPVYYDVYRSTRTDGGWSRITEAPLKADGSGNADGSPNGLFSLDGATGVYSFLDRNETAKAGRKFYYRVLSLNQLGAGSFYSEYKVGWGALTHRQFLVEYDKTRKSAFNKLTYMHKPGSTDKLGTETKNGNISGTIMYSANLSGLGARIIIRFTNYADHYIESNNPDSGVYFLVSGEINTSANMSSNGTQDGLMTAAPSGMYAGTVKYDRLVITGGASGGGTYEVHPEGFPAVEQISYTVVTD